MPTGQLHSDNDGKVAMNFDDFSPSSNVPLPSILYDLRRVGQSSHVAAPLIPAGAFHSPQFLRLEMANIFATQWICVGRSDDFPETGSFIACDIADVPVLVVRQEDGSLKAFVNACAHRRAQVVPTSCGKKLSFSCSYHGWTYSPDGRLLGAPYMDGCPGFDKSQIHLQSLQISSWEGYVFVSLSENRVEPIDERLREFTEQVVGRYRMERYRTIIRGEMDFEGNWKNIIENFTESYHVFRAHKKTFALSGKTPHDYECGGDFDWFGYHFGTQKDESWGGAAHPDDITLEGVWRRRSVAACVYPGLLISLSPRVLWYVSVQPHGVGRFRARWGTAVADVFLDSLSPEERAAWIADQEAFMDSANEEDKPLIAALYRGTRSTRAPRGRLHPIEKNVWDFARYLSRMLPSEVHNP